MQPEQHLFFSAFELDLANEQVWCEGQPVPLRPKLFAILRYLVEQAGRLVSREELTKAVWPDTVVSESVLRGCIRALRETLADDAEAPRFIETIARRGYRFLAPLTLQPVISSQYPVVSKKHSDNAPPPLATNNWQLTTPLVGREAELRQLHGWLEKARQGQRQVVFVTGEPGIGKTTVVEAFLQSLASEQVQGLRSKVQSSNSHVTPNSQSPTPVLWIGRGQCVEQYGPGEAYLPILEAVSRLGRAPGGERLVALFNQYAPTWLVQLPALVSEAELAALQRRVAGATRERMLREAADVLEVLTAETPLVLLLEDLHWSDYATIELLSLVARRREAARLLILATYRPADVVMSGHPLKVMKQELRMHGQCEELALTFLTDVAVAQYLDARFPAHRFPPVLAHVVYRSTDGNPLFMVNTVDSLIQQGTVSEQDGQWQLRTTIEEIGRGVPESLRQLIEKHVERLSEEQQRLLEVASVVGQEFSAAAVAAGLETTIEQVEEQCEGLVRLGQFLQAQGLEVLPDETIAGRYGFLHALYQTVLYERLPAVRRIRLHRRAGESEEQVYGSRVREVAAELVMHFERGQDFQRAVKYLRQATENVLHRYAHREAMIYINRGLGVLKFLPDTPERAQQELWLQVTLGTSLIATKGFTAPEVDQAYTRARELCQQVGETPRLFTALGGLCAYYANRAELQTAKELAEQMLRLAHNDQAPNMLLWAHQALGAVLYFSGEFIPAREHFDQSLTLYDAQQLRFSSFVYDPGMYCLTRSAQALHWLGYQDQALQRQQQALTLARKLAQPYSLVLALACAGQLHQYRREGQATQRQAEAATALATEQGFPLWVAIGTVEQGWALTEQGQLEEGIALIHQGLDACRTIGAKLERPYHLALLAEGYGKRGQAEAGLSVLGEALALVSKSGELSHEAELYRLKGELTLKQSEVRSPKSKVQSPHPLTLNTQPLTPSTQAEAEACFHKAINLARRQQAKSLELRAVMSLARLWHQQGRTKEARQRLAELYEWFTEGWDTADLLEAQSLLTELGHALEKR